MTESELDAESLNPSSKWIEAGTGDLGQLFVEIIGCDGLPNMDTQAMGGGKTDAFVSMIYEDSIVNTEVINDTLRPRWMPWTQVRPGRRASPGEHLLAHLPSHPSSLPFRPREHSFSTLCTHQVI